MEKMIFLTRLARKEYCTIIKKDYTLGLTNKGDKDSCRTRKNFIDYTMGNAIGDFHTHYYSKKEYKKILTEVKGIHLSKTCLLTNEYVLGIMSKQDLNSSIEKEYKYECIGYFTPISKKYQVCCYELHDDKKQRIHNALKTLEWENEHMLYEMLRKLIVKNQWEVVL